MFGLFKSYDDEYLELYEYLTQDWEMKPKYAKAFLNTKTCHRLGCASKSPKIRVLVNKTQSFLGSIVRRD